MRSYVEEFAPAVVLCLCLHLHLHLHLHLCVSLGLCLGLSLSLCLSMWAFAVHGCECVCGATGWVLLGAAGMDDKRTRVLIEDALCRLLCMRQWGPIAMAMVAGRLVTSSERIAVKD